MDKTNHDLLGRLTAAFNADILDKYRRGEIETKPEDSSPDALLAMILSTFALRNFPDVLNKYCDELQAQEDNTEEGYTRYNSIQAEEISLDLCGYSFLCVYGIHVHGGFCALPAWGISAELSTSEEGYNQEKLYTAMSRSEHIRSYFNAAAIETISHELAATLTELMRAGR